jgi:hypothetical protein
LNFLLVRKGKELPDWPDNVLLPIEGWFETARVCGIWADKIEDMEEMMWFTSVGTWRYSQGVYRFDRNIYKALVETTLPDTVPLSVFARLPEWCLYLETPGMIVEGTDIYGVYAFLGYDFKFSLLELRITFDGDGFRGSLPILLSENETIPSAVAKFGYEENPSDDMREVHSLIVEAIKPILSLLLYICSDEPEIDDMRNPGLSPSKVYPQKIKGGFKLFVPNSPRIWDVGKHTGEMIGNAKERRSDSPGEHKWLAPHLRRAHWHGYRTGKGRKTFKFNWILPIAVNISEDE